MRIKKVNMSRSIFIGRKTELERLEVYQKLQVLFVVKGRRRIEKQTYSRI